MTATLSTHIQLAIVIAFCSAFQISCTPTTDNSNVQEPLVRSNNEIGSFGYRAGVGDAIDLFVREDSSFDGQYVVRASGDLILPKAGRVYVLGMTLTEVESAISKKLQSDQLTKATVIADPVRRGAGDGKTVSAGLTIYLTGNVAQRGRVLVPFVGNAQVTAFQAITDVGGFAAFANKKKSYLLRRTGMGPPRRIPVNFLDIESGLIPDPVLQDGDTIVVPQKLIGF
jgi:polysaccharide biosynthesis/export protein